MAYEVEVFGLYFVLVLLPMGIYSALVLHYKPYKHRIPNPYEDSWIFYWRRKISIALSLYVTKQPSIVCFYHILLTAGLALFCANEVIQNLTVAVDLNYYIKTSIRATEAYDAIQHAKYHESFYYWYHHESRRLASGNDLVAVYHASGSDWQNVLTAERLVDICNTERAFISSQPCLGPDFSTMIDVIFDNNCHYFTSFDESLPLFGLPENAAYVEDNIDPAYPQSSVLLSFYSTSCSLSLNSVENSVESVESSSAMTDMCYAQNDLLTDAFIESGLNDLELSLIAMFLCLVVLSVSLGVKVLFAFLFMLCLVFALVIAAGTLPLFGFSYFSAFNVLAIFVITGVGADSVIVFVSAWRKSYAKAKKECVVGVQAEESEIRSSHEELLNLFPSVLHHSYGSVIAALTFTVMTTMLSFMANLVSPIVVIAQLGAFMGIAMATYFLLLHLILIPGWIFVMKAYLVTGACNHCKTFLTRTRIKLQSIGFAVAAQCGESLKLLIERVKTESPEGSSDGDNDVEVRPNSVMLSSEPVRKKQGYITGCSAFVLLIGSILLVLFGILSVMNTDFGLPLLFEEGTNISDLMYVAKNFKSDLLTLSGNDESSVVPDTGTKSPTPASSSSPTTTAPTLAPSEAVTFAPSEAVTFAPSQTSTFAPSMSDSSSSSDQTMYTVYVCYGVEIEKKSFDSDATSTSNPGRFAPYAEQGLLSDTETLCNYLEENRRRMEVTTPNSECIYNQLMAVTSENVSIYDRIGMWMSEDSSRFFQVGVEATGEGPGSGNFGQEYDLLLSWLCQPISCTANVTSFYDDPNHALRMIDRWDNVVYDVASDEADAMGVESLTGSEAWVFPLLSDHLVKSIYISSGISFFGTLFLLFVATGDLKIAMLVGLGMLFVIMVSVLLHALLFSTAVDLIDIIVLISFIGIIVDYPTHMAFHYEHDLKMRRKNFVVHRPSLPGFRRSSISQKDMTLQQKEDSFHFNSFCFMRFALIGPAMTTLISATPLLFAEFTLISKAGEYVVIMCICTYLYVAIAMPTLIRLVREFVFFPCQFVSLTRIWKSEQDSESKPQTVARASNPMMSDTHDL